MINSMMHKTYVSKKVKKYVSFEKKIMVFKNLIQ